MKYATCHIDRKHHAKGMCSICYSESRKNNIREWKQKNKHKMLQQQHKYERELPEHIKANWRLNTRFGISIADYELLLEIQGGGCAICHRKPNGERLCVDHNHVTGKVRGLLCRNCNYIMHVFDDSDKLYAFLLYKQLDAIVKG